MTTTPVEFAERCAAAAADLALALAHEPDEKVAASLAAMRANLEARLTKVFVVADAAAVAEMFVAAVVARRREIEAAGETPPALN
jgi:predicted DNA-binding ArsR family transcriptional regulator